ncbi:MAG: hypothetical protein ABIH42_00250 [Planctomycetota bacterium]
MSELPVFLEHSRAKIFLHGSRPFNPLGYTGTILAKAAEAGTRFPRKIQILTSAIMHFSENHHKNQGVRKMQDKLFYRRLI